MGHIWNPTPARNARRAQRLTQEEVAEAVGVERKAITRWEGGTAPTVDRAADLADVLGLSLDSLVALPIEENPDTGSTARGKTTRDGGQTAKSSAVPAHSGG